jgi:hypothetical protein
MGEIGGVFPRPVEEKYDFYTDTTFDFQVYFICEM